MTKTSLCLAAFSLFAAVPAPARTVPAPQPSSATQKPDAKQRYCVQIEPITGSRIRTRECRTCEDWQWKGVELDVK